MHKREEVAKSPDENQKKSLVSGFFQRYGYEPIEEFDIEPEKVYYSPTLNPHEGRDEGELTETDIRKKFLELIDTADEGLLERAFKAAKKIVDGAMLTKAPLLWRDRDRSRKLKCTEFVLETYKPWIEKGLRRHHLKEIDPQLYQTLSTYYSRNGVPPELESLEAVDDKVTDDFLKKHGINEPKDAYRVFIDDPKEANRVYSAAHRKLTK